MTGNTPKKIYTSVEYQWNRDTKQYDIINEESFNYSGPLSLAAKTSPNGNENPANPGPKPPQTTQPGDPGNIGAPTGGGLGGSTIPLDTAEGYDKITETNIVTAGYFTGGAGTLNGINVHTASLADSNEKYYINVCQTHPLSASAEVQFAVAYGHQGGSGSDTDSAAVEGPTEAVYKYWANTLLGENEISGGFRISTNEGNNPTGKTLSAKDNDIYVLVGKRERFKQRLNKKNWTIIFSGSNSGGSGSYPLHLTDDSATTNAKATVMGDRYNIVSGTQGSVSGSGASHKVYGWLYPEPGVMVFSAAELSASIPGYKTSSNKVEFRSGSHFGFATNGAANLDEQNAVRMVNCLIGGRSTNTYTKLRSEEMQVAMNYFCRVTSRDLNYTSNPTFVSGSANRLRYTDMYDTPVVYISEVGLFNSMDQLVAVGKLSSPLKKSFSDEATIKVKLTY